METQASRDLVQDYYRALGSGDAAALERLLADDVEWIPPKSSPIDDVYRGRDAVLKGMAEAGARFFDLSTAKSTTRKMVADGDTVVVLSSLACKARNGRDYSNEYIWVFTCADGRITRLEEHVDTLRFQRIVLD